MNHGEDFEILIWHKSFFRPFENSIGSDAHEFNMQIQKAISYVSIYLFQES